MLRTPTFQHHALGKNLNIRVRPGLIMYQWEHFLEIAEVLLFVDTVHGSYGIYKYRPLCLSHDVECLRWPCFLREFLGDLDPRLGICRI